MDMNAPLWLSNLVFWSAQVALLVLAAGLLPRLLRLRQPDVLLFYWRSILALTLALPFLQPWHRTRLTAVAAVDFVPVPVNATPSPAASHWQLPSLQSVAPILGALLLAGVAVRFIVLFLGLLKLRRLRKACLSAVPLAESAPLLQEMCDRVKARAEFRLSTQIDSPVTFGFRAPLILLPERFTSLDPRFQSAIACHELLHVRRHDWAHHLAEEFLRSLSWFHPGIGWLISRIRLAREQVVDLEVVRLSQERKTYVDALLEFTNARAFIAAIPAPPFLAECQLVERIALMVKEVRMSRGRLVGSLAAASSCLILVLFFAARMFPLKAALRPAQNVVQKDVAGRVSGAVSGGISNGVSGGVAQGVANGVANGVSGGVSGTRQVKNNSSSDEPSVAYNAIWTDTVKRGPMLRQVRGLGKLVSAGDSLSALVRTRIAAEITVPVYLTVEVRPNQSATVDTRMGLVKGHVASVNPSGDTCSIEVALDSALPERATVGLSIDGTIDIETLENVLYVGRPVHGDANTTVGLFKISKDGLEAQRVNVKLGRSSVNTIEILDGLQAGDKIILSDMAEYDNVDHIRLTNNTQLQKH